MKQQTTWLAAWLIAGALGCVVSGQAQSVTGTPYLSNLDPATLNTLPNATYANWNNPSLTTFTSLSTGLEVSSGGYGSLYYVVPDAEVQTLNPADAYAILTVTVNAPSPANINWFGLPFILNDASGAVDFEVYSGPGNAGNPSTVTWNGNVVTEAVPLTAAELAAVQAGSDAIYGFNLEANPSNFTGAPVYDITFNSLVLSPTATPTPEPATCSLVGLGLAGLLVLRRRK